ncbi:MAG: PQQ-binding-like beta-propeller repeat protein [Phycisphaerae bacterium]
MRTMVVVICGTLLAAGLAAAPGEEWPGWRGPRGDGTSTEKAVPVRWSETENVRWKVPIPGKGHSSPIVWGDRIFVTTCEERATERRLLCLGRSQGKVLWERVVLRAGLERRNRLNSYASSTPVTDGKHVWVSFMEGLKTVVWVVCYDMGGKEVWRRSPGELHSMHGFCSSLLLYKDMIILNGDQDDVAYIVAFDKATGAERWRADRPNRTRSYCPPVVFDVAGKKQLVLSGSKCVASYDPDTGKQRWIVDGPTEQFVASLVETQGILMMTGGYPTLHIIGIRPDGTGNVTNSHVIWHVKEHPSYVPSPIAEGEHFFLVSDKGMASCLEARTGKYLWTRRLGRHHSASPVSADRRLYFLDDDGQTFVIRASGKFELLATNKLGDKCFASPAISGGGIFIRSARYLYCIAEAKKE